eukprot:TRINITY_DN7797_c0_g1_i12.p1 TRINITY_DN7797_c0_g1~~TRINITY_DN7797_c0_g1_i12.p1  ORF type:complete len:632 (+),score=171.03 TRINITY_DN7797_c0_g1_i12:1477-3372(+)
MQSVRPRPQRVTSVAKRKEKRKEARKEKKRRRSYTPPHKTEPLLKKKKTDTVEKDAHELVKLNFPLDKQTREKSEIKQKQASQDKEKTVKETTKCGPRRTLSPDEEDDRVIAMLERKLKLTGNKLVGEGLDEILYGDEDERRELKKLLGDKYKATPLDEEYEAIKINSSQEEEQQSEKEMEDEGEQFSQPESEEEMLSREILGETDNHSKENDNPSKEDEENDNYSKEDEEIEKIDEEEIAEDEEDKRNSTNEALQLKLNSSQGKYVPPALRGSIASSDLERQLRGFVNKISDSNLLIHVDLVEKVYQKFPSFDVNTKLAEIIVDMCSQKQLQVKQIIPTYAALLTVLHAIKGTEVGGIVLEILAKKFSELYLISDVTSQNLLLLLVYLYNFEIVHSKLIFEMISNFINSFKEIDIELLLVCLTNCGISLRSDDPRALKEIISMVFSKAELAGANIQVGKKVKTKQSDETRKNSVEGGGKPFSLRVEFMLEMIISLKNNKLQERSTPEFHHLKRLKHITMDYLRKRKLQENLEKLYIPWADLVSGEMKGRRWMVGSAFAAPSEREQQQKWEELGSLNMDVADEVFSRVTRMCARKDLSLDFYCLATGGQDLHNCSGLAWMVNMLVLVADKA